MAPRILIAIHTDTFFGELLRLARTLQQSGEYEPVFFFPHYYPNISDHVDRCLAEGLRCLDHRGKPMTRNTAVDMHTIVKNPRTASKIKNILRRWHLLQIVEKIIAFKDLNQRSFDNVFFEMWYLRQRIGFIRKVIRTQDIALVVLGGDLVHYDTACFIRAARLTGRPSVIVPCTMSNALEMAESYYPIKKYHLNRFPNNLVGRFFPEWVYAHKQRKLLRLPAAKVLAMKLLKLSPSHPWINLSGFADRIAVESEAMVDYYTREGIPPIQLEVTGTISDDTLTEGLRLADQHRRDLYKKYDIVGDQPMILTALPPDQLYMVGGRPECEFSSYPELVEYWLNTLAAVPGYSIIVNLHPSLSYELWKQRSRPGVTIVQENITSLLPLCLIFVASISTVIRWAIACGKPVVNYDVYRFRYNDYAGVPGVVTIEERSEFEQVLRRITTDQQYYHQLVAAQSQQSTRWGKLDGHATDRILALFKTVLTKKIPSPTV